MAPPGCKCKARMRLAGRPVARVASVIRSSPMVLLVPLLLFTVCVIGGIIAVRYASTSYANSERTKALSLVNTATTVRACPQATLDSRACTMAAALESCVPHTPQTPSPPHDVPHSPTPGVCLTSARHAGVCVAAGEHALSAPRGVAFH
jgi:hypothetical protein